MINSPIVAVFSDVDGVLTDNRLSFASDAPAKRFHVRDGHGVMLLRQAGIYCAWISGRDDVAMRQRAAELKIDWFIASTKQDKGQLLLSLLKQKKIAAAQTIFLGDDTTDLAAFAQVGWPVAVADADPLVCRAARRVTRRAGGNGAFREVVDWVLAVRG